MIQKIFEKKKSVLTIFLFIVLYGLYTYISIPKESFPDIKIPYVITTINYKGVSPEDGEKMIARKLEKEFKSLEGVKSMETTCFEGGCQTVLEFYAGLNSDKVLTDVREKVDTAKAHLPKEADEPIVMEFSTSQFPIIVANLSGNVPENTLLNIANRLKTEVESIPGILEVEIIGDKKEQVEILVDPIKLSAYEISLQEFAAFLAKSNVLIPAGNLETATGEFPLKVVGLIDNADALLNLPIKTFNDSSTLVKDVASVKLNREDAKTNARINYKKVISLNVKKRAGVNIISSVESVKYILEKAKTRIPEQIQISYTNDYSTKIKNTLLDLNNSVLLSIVLVVAIVIMMLGRRSGILVGVSIPVSFLMGILGVYLFGATLNMVVLFGLVLSVGMLVDGAIVITEEADRRMRLGETSYSAYMNASKRMAMPIISSTATTLAVFFPLLFWPGIMGEFMSYLPLTVICVLTASLITALVLVPCIGSFYGKLDKKDLKKLQKEDNEIYKHGIYKAYTDILQYYLSRPKRMIGYIVILLFGVIFLQGITSKGIEFFPSQEPDFISLMVSARGNLSLTQKDIILKNIEEKIGETKYFKTIYTQVNAKPNSAPDDTIGYIQFEMKDWDERPKADKIIKELKQKTSGIPGIKIQIEKQKDGPSQGKPIEIEISSTDSKNLPKGVAKVLDAMTAVGHFSDTEDTRPLPGIQWEIKIDRTQASKFGVDINSAGQMIQMLTSGIRFSTYHGGSSDEEVYIIARFPKDYRSLDEMKNLRITSPYGQVPLSNFITITPTDKISQIKRVDGVRVMTIKANTTPGTLPSNQIKVLKQYLEKNPPSDDVKITFKGEEQDKAEASSFILLAFISAIALIAIILLLQFNSFYAVAIILLTIILSTIGVFAGIIILGVPFSLIMHGIGIVSLAGIVVNNNIILIDTYNDFRQNIKDKREAILQTGIQRLRPILLTTITTVLGLIPMAIGLNIDFINQIVELGNPAVGMWQPLAQSICFGLAFSTVLTLLITPCLLILKKD